MERRLPNASTRPFTTNLVAPAARMRAARRCLSQMASSAKAVPSVTRTRQGWVGLLAGSWPATSTVPGDDLAGHGVARVARGAAVDEGVGEVEEQVAHPGTAGELGELLGRGGADAAQVGERGEEGGERVGQGLGVLRPVGGQVKEEGHRH